MKKPLLVVFLVLLIDQASKIWIKTNMFLGQEFRVFDWFIIHFTENNGMAFGMEFAGEYGKLFLTLFRIVAVGGLFYYLYKLVQEKAHKGFITSIALILAGAIGNIIDSVFYGKLFGSSYHQVAEVFPDDGGYAPLLYGRVVDMLYFPITSGYFPEWFPIWGGEYFLFFRPVFNVADSAITIGVLLIILFQGKFFADHSSLEPVSTAPDQATSTEESTVNKTE
jgi:signal peptidase II